MGSSDLISRLSSRFANAALKATRPDDLTRDIGGQFRTNQPHITGYFQIMVGLPEELFKHGEVASKWLHSACESFTPHSQTINKIDIQGQGQIGSSFVSSITTNREFTLAFREYRNLPILNIIKQWAAIMDPFTGVSPLGGDKFLPQNYKGWVAVAQTKPTRSQDGNLKIEDIEECYIYQGVFPTTIPIDALASDITANDTSQLSVTFSFDGAPLTSAEKGVTKKVVELFNGLNPISDTFDKYMEAADNGFSWSGFVGEIVDDIASVFD